MSSSALSRARRRSGSIAPGFLVLLAIASLAACGESTGPAGQAARLEAVPGADLVGTVGEPLDGSVQVKVTDGRGRRVAGVDVEFVASPGGLVAAEPDQSGSMRTTVATNLEGVAAVVWTLGESAGEQVVTATAGDLPPVEYRAVAQPGPPAALVPVAGDNQLGIVGEGLASALTTRVRDKYGNGIPETAVSWDIVVGEGTLSAQSSRTDESGETSVELTLGPTVGLRSVTVRHGALDPAEFVVIGLSVVAEDAAGDTFSYGTSKAFVLPDIVSLGAGWHGDTLMIGVVFKDLVTPAHTLGPNFMGGNLDFDTDFNSETGEVSAIDVQRRSGEDTGMGVDLYVDMFTRSNGNFVMFAFDPLARFVGWVTPTFRDKLVYFSLPSMVDADSITMALVVATNQEATDIAPNDGAIVVRRPSN